MNQNKQIIAALAAVVAITTIYFVIPKKNTNQNQQQQPQPITKLYGEVIEVKDSSVIIEGAVNAQFKRVEFALTPQTVYKNTVIQITKQQIDQDGQFQPEQVVRQGSKGGLRTGVTIYSVTTNEDLSKTDKATALEINYQSYELPKIQ